MLIRDEQSIYKATFLLIILFVAIFASAYGVLSPDSRAYIDLAQSLKDGAGCSVDGKYYATEACGYPLLIVALNAVSGLGDLITASKLVNFILLFGGFVFLLKTIKNLPLATLFFINPIVMYVYSYTWSENLLLFAFCASFYFLNRLRDLSSKKSDVLYLTLFLVVGCFSRYFFGPFCCVIWLSAYMIFGRRVAIRALPAFVVAAIVYFAYQRFNLAYTGYPTGMERMHAPETAMYLMTAFLVRVIGAYLALFFTVFVYRIVARQNWKIMNFSDLVQSIKNNSDDFAAYKFLLLAGLGFLLLSFIIRFVFYFDLFDFRIIGFGVVFTSIALLGLGSDSSNWGGWKNQIVALVVIGFFSLLSTQNLANWKSIFKASYQSPQKLITSTHSSIHNKTIFSFGVPSPSNFVPGNNHYYDDNSQVLNVSLGPAYRVENFDSFIARVKKYANDDCVFDFTWYADKEEFAARVNKVYPVALDFSKSMFKPERVVAPSYDPQIANFLLKVYRPKAAVSCDEALAQ